MTGQHSRKEDLWLLALASQGNLDSTSENGENSSRAVVIPDQRCCSYSAVYAWL